MEEKLEPTEKVTYSDYTDLDLKERSRVNRKNRLRRIRHSNLEKNDHKEIEQHEEQVN